MKRAQETRTRPDATPSQLEEFYSGQTPDNCGRRIEEIWAWDDSELELVHDYIQWLFPSRRPSDFNPDAPILTDAVAAAFHANPELQKRLLKSFRRMLQFYGFHVVENEAAVVIERTPNCGERFAGWVSPEDHNHLRISRILACLRGVGLGGYARAFLEALEAVRLDFPTAISSRTLEFWRSAAR